MIQNPELLRLRLSPQEKYYYTNLFYEHSINEKVSRHKFPELLGLLGTDIAENFAFRIFDTFSSDKKSIRLNEYLKYVDVYHYGDEIERCRVTFKLMDKSGDGQISLSEFEDYLSLIIAAIKKVHPGVSENLLSPKEITMLFNKIANNNKSTFSFMDFEKVYIEKPELLSWIDYFKNNDEEVLVIIHNNLRELLLMIQKFFQNFSEIMKNNSDLDELKFKNDESIDLTPAIDEINKFCKVIEKKRKVFVNSAGGFNIRTIFENLTKSFNDTKFFTNKQFQDQTSPERKSKSAFISKEMNTKLHNDYNLTKISTNINVNNSNFKGMIVDNENQMEENQDQKIPNSDVMNTNIEENIEENKANKEAEYAVFLKRFSSKLVNDQFKHLKNNIHYEIQPENVINEEEYDQDHDEDPHYEKEKMIREGFKRISINLGLRKNSNHIDENVISPKKENKNKLKPSYFQIQPENNLNINNIPNNNDISNLENFVNKQFHKQSFSTSKNEVIIFDDTIHNSIVKKNKKNDSFIANTEQLNIDDIKFDLPKEGDNSLTDREKDLLLKFHSQSKNSGSLNMRDTIFESKKVKASSPQKIKKQNTRKTDNSLGLLTKYQVPYMERFNSTEKLSVPLLGKRLSKHQGETIGNLNINEERNKFKIDDNNSNLLHLFRSMKKLCDTSCQMIKWIEQSYKWVENRYLKNHLIKNKKKSSHGATGKEQNPNDARFSIQNIPKNLKDSKNKSKSKGKNKNNLLKATDDNFKILLNIIMGIQLAIQSTPNIKVSSKEDLSKYLNSLNYSIQTINFGSKRQETFYIKEYAGIIFNNIRKLYDIDKDIFISSISPQDFITEMMISSTTIIEELCSTGKSGSLFYYTRDGRFILKTISFTEYNFLKKILANYFKHLMENKGSLLPKFFGCYKLVKKVKKSKSRVYFVIMQNIFSTNKEIHLRYDLKGSKIGRQVIKENQQQKFKGINKLSYALKDLDLENNKHYFGVGDKKKLIMDQLKRDSQFLAENSIIDYSLLVGLHITDLENTPHKNGLEHPLSTLRKRYNNTISPHRNHQSHINNRNSMGSHFNELNQKESYSLRENKHPIINIDDEDKLHNSDYSIYNMDIKFSENNDSVNEMDNNKKHNFENDIDDNKFPYRDFEDGGIKSITNKEIYFLGIIDILTEYNCSKKFEYISKLFYYCSNKMSCIPPNGYRIRFNNYMETKFLEDLYINKITE